MSGQIGKTQSTNNTARTTRTTAKKAEQKPKAKQPVPVGTSKAKKTELKEPKKPTPIQRKTTFEQEGKATVGGICDKYNMTKKRFMQLNPQIKDLNKVKPNQEIKIEYVPKEKQQKYAAEKAKYDEQVYQADKKERVKIRKGKAQSLIDKAKKDGRGEDYTYRTDEDGNIIVKLKNKRSLGQIKEDFNLPDGSLRETNDLKEKFGKIGNIEFDGIRTIKNWDVVEAQPGTELVINTDDFSTERTWKQATKDNAPKWAKDAYHKVKSWF